jgi:hypothetical protein
MEVRFPGDDAGLDVGPVGQVDLRAGDGELAPEIGLNRRQKAVCGGFFLGILVEQPVILSHGRSAPFDTQLCLRNYNKSTGKREERFSPKFTIILREDKQE